MRLLRAGGFALAGASLAVACSSDPDPGDDGSGGGGASGKAGKGGSAGSMGGTTTGGRGGDSEGGAGRGGTSGTSGASGADDGGAGNAGEPNGGSGGAGNEGGNGESGAGGDAGDGPVVEPPSCRGMLGTECRGESCCETLRVPGGTFDQGEPDAFRSTVSTFHLDKYETNVSRFRRFVTAYDSWMGAGNPIAGAGAHPRVAGSGWDPAWNALLPQDVVTLTGNGEGLKCAGALSTWLDNAGHELHPINCITWYVSYAFCIWDGGRLPTEAEYEYAAAGGSEDRLYPWGDTPVPSDTMATHAAYDCMGDGSAPGSCTVDDMPPGGAFPLGRGRFGHMDIVGNLGESVRDYAANYPSTPQTDYVNLVPGDYIMLRSGDWDGPALQITSAHRNFNVPWEAHSNYGVRCARDL